MEKNRKNSQRGSRSNALNHDSTTTMAESGNNKQQNRFTSYLNTEVSHDIALVDRTEKNGVLRDATPHTKCKSDANKISYFFCLHFADIRCERHNTGQLETEIAYRLACCRSMTMKSIVIALIFF